MDKATEKYILEQKMREPADSVLEFYRERPAEFSNEFFEELRKVLVARGVASLSHSPSEEATIRSEGAYTLARGPSPMPYVAGGVLIGGVAGYLTGASTFVPLVHVLTRGLFLSGLDSVLIPLAQQSFNATAAGAVVGAGVGFAVFLVVSNQPGVGRARGTEAVMTQVGSICPHCASTIDANAKFCGQCGKSVEPKECQKCGKPVPEMQKFCGFCGSSITSETDTKI